ncbi:MAG: bifunctional DNA-binding transcriptional regulator/O6-methylguanine-DNA methyltransferase Ada [Pseudomonadota bacterium]|nr:MAG: bifunctional DNA-binding transcriptional regulator/O6-methylguanine-DNA methyltransferase Ada [Pseudomonadota bacterium]
MKAAANARSTVVSDPRWTAVAERDERATFVYSVASTGIYCRPSCPARRPRPENVAFHPSPVAAELAGFRPCKRCMPREALSEAVARPVIAMCKRIEESEHAPSLRELARHVGLSEGHAHRSFVRATGLTPKAYRDAVLRRRLQHELRERKTVTEAIYTSGFNSAGRFYEHVARALGMSPSTYRAGAHGLTIRFAVGQCSLGAILVAATERGVCSVLLGDDPEALVHDLERRFPHAELVGGDRAFDELVARVVGVVEARPGVAVEALPLDVRGTVFQERVWRALRKIPPGATKTYAEIAASIGAPRAVRAVAGACAANPVAVLIPCHRVVRTDGSLSGYRWGIERKRALLRRERSAHER